MQNQCAKKYMYKEKVLQNEQFYKHEKQSITCIFPYNQQDQYSRLAPSGHGWYWNSDCIFEGLK